MNYNLNKLKSRGKNMTKKRLDNIQKAINNLNEAIEKPIKIIWEPENYDALQEEEYELIRIKWV